MEKYKKLFNLEKLNIFIVGGSGLLGSEIVKSLVDLNAIVTVFDLEEKKDIKKNNFKFIKLDCSNTDDIENTFKEISYKSYKKNIEIHLNSYIWLAKIIADQMKKNKIHGSIIQLSSIYGLVAQDDNLYKNTNISENMTYGIIKSSVIHFTKQLASHYGKNNIRVNNIIVGGVSGHIKGSKLKQDLNFLKKFKNKVPLGRMADPAEIVPGVVFLASSASSYITGSSIVIDGGYTIL